VNAGASNATAPALTAEPPIRLMIVDDSPIARSVLSRMVSSHADLQLVALAGNAGEAIETLGKVVVDIVLLDVEMPGTSGLEALPEILKKGNGARVLIVSSLGEDGADAAVQALTLGATDTLPKPGTGSFGGRFADVLVERLRRIGRVGARAAVVAPAPEAAPLTLRAMPDARIGCLALGASTGGLHALSEFLRALPAKVGAPILVTQHLPAVFMPFFARQIEAASRRSAQVATDGVPLVDEDILIAPGDAHLQVEQVASGPRVRLGTGPVSSGCMPSVDPMLWSVSEAYGRNGLGVIFSGMGRDGLVGSARLVEAGGAVIAQDQQSSAVWGMPRAVAEAGLASAVLPPKELAGRVSRRIETTRWK
jgi:two-component system chemotaxis response regulator CheB